MDNPSGGGAALQYKYMDNTSGEGLLCPEYHCPLGLHMCSDKTKVGK